MTNASKSKGHQNGDCDVANVPPECICTMDVGRALLPVSKKAKCFRLLEREGEGEFVYLNIEWFVWDESLGWL